MTQPTNSNSYKIAIFLTLVSTPLFYISIISYLLDSLFVDETNRVIFQLYNAPFWFLLMFITGVELYRRAVITPFKLVAPVYMIMMGSVIIGVTGIIICPAGPSLLSSGGSILIATNLSLAAISGGIIKVFFARSATKKYSG